MSSVLWLHVALVRADDSEEHIVSIFSVTRLWVFIARSEDVRHDGRREDTFDEARAHQQYFHGKGQTQLRRCGCNSLSSPSDVMYILEASWEDSRVLSPLYWRRYVPPKRRSLLEPHGVISQKTVFFDISCFSSMGSYSKTFDEAMAHQQQFHGNG
jgi:hypothetical protein